jgi:hypothetical protein
MFGGVVVKSVVICKTHWNVNQTKSFVVFYNKLQLSCMAYLVILFGGVVSKSVVICKTH